MLTGRVDQGSGARVPLRTRLTCCMTVGIPLSSLDHTLAICAMRGVDVMTSLQ